MKFKFIKKPLRQLQTFVMTPTKIFYFIMSVIALIGVIFSILNLINGDTKTGLILLPIMSIITLYWILQLRSA